MNSCSCPSESHLHSWLIVGPDGSGKTAVADHLEARIRRSGARVERLHCRPRLRRRISTSTPVTRPHATGAYPPPLAALKLVVLLVTWLIDALRRRLPGSRCTVTVMERGWFDMVVDPVRYALLPSFAPVASLMGRCVPKADVVLVLRGSPEAIDARKPEIGAAEVRRQMAAWDRLAPRSARLVLSADTVAADSAAVVENAWQSAAAAVSAPGRLRWRRVPLTPRRLQAWAAGDPWYAASFYRSYNPTAAALAPVRRALLTGTPGRSTEAPVALEEISRLLGFRVDGALAITSSTPGRLNVLCGHARSNLAFVKVGAPDDPRLANEASMLRGLRSQPGNYHVPRLRWAGDWRERLVVVTDGVAAFGKPIYDLQVAERICTSLVNGSAGSPPMVHGDFAPWNIVGSVDAPTLIDWEFGRRERMPLFDLARFIVSCAALLGKYEAATARALLCDPGGPGWQHLERVGVSPRLAPMLLQRYFESAAWLGGAPERRFYNLLLREHRAGHVD